MGPVVALIGLELSANAADNAGHFVPQLTLLKPGLEGRRLPLLGRLKGPLPQSGLDHVAPAAAGRPCWAP